MVSLLSITTMLTGSARPQSIEPVRASSGPHKLTHSAHAQALGRVARALTARFEARFPSQTLTKPSRNDGLLAEHHHHAHEHRFAEEHRAGESLNRPLQALCAGCGGKIDRHPLISGRKLGLVISYVY